MTGVQRNGLFFQEFMHAIELAGIVEFLLDVCKGFPTIVSFLT